MELTKFRYFYAVAKYQHVTKAAEEICIAQPALTKTIKQLEEELGVKLIEKAGRNIRLTPYGVFLKEKLDDILPRIDSIPDEINALKESETRTIRLNILAASAIVTGAVISYKKIRPQAVFKIVQNEEEKSCDVSVGTNSVNMDFSAGAVKKTVFEEKIYLAVPRSSSYADKQSINLGDVKNEGFVSIAGSRLFRTVCDKFCMIAGFSPVNIFESDSPATVRDMIGASAGVGFWPEYSWGKLNSKTVALLPISSPQCMREIIICRHGGAANSAYVDEFYEYLVKAFKNAQRNHSPK